MNEPEPKDVRDAEAPDYDPREALTECLDLWGSGAWPDENAVYHLEEVMDHVQRLLDKRRSRERARVGLALCDGVLDS